MPTEVVRIIIEQKGARKTAGEVDRVGKAAKSSGDAVDFFKRALAGLAVFVGLNELRQLSDTYVEIQNRLRIVTSSTAELVRVQDNLAKVARDTRTSFQLTAENYARVALATQDLGTTSDETARFVELVNKVIQASGVNAREAEAGLIQFSQGLASNRLAGDELKSVLEGVPELGRQIAKGLGVAFGDLRRLGAQQELTTEKVFGAILKRGGEIEALYDRTTASISKALVNIQTALIQFIGRTDESLGITRALVTLLKVVEENVNLLATAFFALAGAVGVFAAAAAAPKIAAAFVAITAFAAANPLVITAAGATAAATAFGLLGDKITIVGTQGVSALDVFKAFGLSLLEFVNPLELIGFALEGVKAGLLLLGGAAEFSVGSLLTIPALFGDLLHVFLGGIPVIGRITELFSGFTEITTEVAGRGLDNVQEAFNGATSAATGFLGSIVGLPGRVASLARQFAALRDASAEQLLTPLARGLIEQQRRGGRVDTRSDVLQGLRDEILARQELVGLSKREERVQRDLGKLKKQLSKELGELSEEELAPLRAALEVVEDSRAAFEGLTLLADIDPAIAALDEFTRKEELLAQAFAEGQIGLEQYNAAFDRITEDYRAALDPIDEVVRGLEEQIRVLQTPERDRGAVRALIQAENEARKLGKTLTSAQVAEVTNLANKERDIKELLERQKQLRKESLDFNKRQAAELEKRIATGQKLLFQFRPGIGGRAELAEQLQAVRDLAEFRELDANVAADLEERIRRSFDDQLDPLGKINRELRERTRLLRLSAQEAAIEAEVVKRREELVAGGFTPEAAAAAAEGLRSTIRLNEELEKQRKTIETLGDEINRSLVKSFAKATEGLAEFLVTGEKGALNFSKTLQNLAKQLANIALQRSLGGAFSRLLGGGGGGLLGGLFGSRGGGGGGGGPIGVLAPTLAPGVSGPLQEGAFKTAPLPSIPGAVATGGKLAQVVVNTKVDVNTQGGALSETDLNDTGKRTGVVIEKFARDAVRRVLQEETRVGGQLNPARVV